MLLFNARSRHRFGHGLRVRRWLRRGGRHVPQSAGRELVHRVPVLVDDVGELVHVAVRLEPGVGAHLGLGLGQPGVALHRVIHVHQVRVGGAKHGHRGCGPRPHELLVQVHVLVAPAPDGRVQAAGGRQVGGVRADDAEPVLPPISGVLVDQEVVRRPGRPAVHHDGVVFAVHDGEVHGVAADRVQPDSVQRLGRPQHVHVDEEQQVVRRRAGRVHGARVQRFRPGELVTGVRKHRESGVRVTGSELGHRRGRPVSGGSSVGHHRQRDALVVGQAHRLVVVHEPCERGQPVEQRQHEVNRLGLAVRPTLGRRPFHSDHAVVRDVPGRIPRRVVVVVRFGVLLLRFQLHFRTVQHFANFETCNDQIELIIRYLTIYYNIKYINSFRINNNIMRATKILF